MKFVLIIRWRTGCSRWRRCCSRCSRSTTTRRCCRGCAWGWPPSTRATTRRTPWSRRCTSSKVHTYTAPDPLFVCVTLFHYLKLHASRRPWEKLMAATPPTTAPLVEGKLRYFLLARKIIFRSFCIFKNKKNCYFVGQLKEEITKILMRF
jgi:hypothetical protein